MRRGGWRKPRTLAADAGGDTGPVRCLSAWGGWQVVADEYREVDAERVLEVGPLDDGLLVGREPDGDLVLELEVVHGRCSDSAASTGVDLWRQCTRVDSNHHGETPHKALNLGQAAYMCPRAS